MERMPVFVKVEEYKEVLHLMKTIRRKLEEAKETLGKVHELKNEEDHQLDLWENTLVEIEKKVDFIDQSLNEPEQY
ncbi:hypothetical protein HYS49_00795 [Candidatus Woesearchaeota archaeon]|nr:hypothetical protein [Candidatus Woesearchaeota archaeon]MDP3640582.1 hypothetical protein [Nanoarchaeota archaeon]